MTTWLPTAFLATGLAATIAIGLAGASVHVGKEARVASKADRLPVVASYVEYVTVETRDPGVSVINRLPLGHDD